MTRPILIALPLAFFFGACDTPDSTPNDDAVEAEAQVAAPDGEHRGRGKLARLDTDKDGSISLAEAQAHPKFAEHFAELDADKDGKLTRDELHAMHGKFGKHGKGKRGDRGDRGDWHDKSPEERAAHKLAKFDRNGDKALTADEVAGHRFADKFAEIDADKDGKLTLDELTTYKQNNPGRGHGDKHGGKHGDKDRGGKEMHGERGKKSPEERAAAMFARFDANADKAITRDEVAGHFLADKFALADGDADGKLTQDELIAFKGKRGDAPAVR